MFNNLDFLVYSSHKSSTQSLVKTLEKNNYNARHLHTLKDIENTKEEFVNNLKEYININKKKLKILSVIRNPNDRLISSFFQTNYDDMIFFNKIQPEETIIQKYDVIKLYSMFKDSIINKDMLGLKESLLELKEIFNFNIKNEFIFKNNFFYYENGLCKIYILDFNLLITDSVLNYLKSALNIKLTNYESENLSKNKPYYHKYIQLKKIIKNENEIHENIKQLYEKNEISLYYHFIK